MNEEQRKANTIVSNANALHFTEVEGEQGVELSADEQVNLSLAGVIKDRFDKAARARKFDEDRWVQAYHNFRGIYPKNFRFTAHEKSKVFIKVTKTKVLAAYGQLIDVIFGAGSFPLAISETREPEGVDRIAHLDINNPAPDIETTSGYKPKDPLNVGYKGDGKETVAKKIQKGKYDKLEQDVPLVSGKSPTPQMVEVSPAKKAARRMERLIHDQIEESKGSTELRNAMFEMALFGTSIIKGPFNYDKTLHRWEEAEDGTRAYDPCRVRVPRIEFVSVWDFFPDPSATEMSECEYIVHRHKFNTSQLRGLMNLPHFRASEVRECVRMGPNYVPHEHEQELKDDQPSEEQQSNLFEVLEYWGYMDANLAKQVGLDLEDVDDLDEVQLNVWMCNGRILRCVVNPFTPHRIPYFACPYEKNPYSFFGIGVAENMDDAQQVMNGHARMAIDNLALSGSLVFDIDESALVGGQTMDIYPGKIFKRQMGMPGQAIHALKFPNTSQENMMMFDKFRQLADEQTGIPSYSHGQTGVQSMTRTASGMSMLLGAASLNIKTVIKNLDDFMLQPLGEAFFQWNMQFSPERLGIVGDLQIKATGTNSLMQKEVRSQRLTMFMQTAANPAVAPFIRMDKLISELAYSLDLDPDELLNTPEEAMLAAQIMGEANLGQANSSQAGPAGEQSGGMGSPNAMGGISTETGSTGNGQGNIGTGNVPQVGEPEFSGNA